MTITWERRIRAAAAAAVLLAVAVACGSGSSGAASELHGRTFDVTSITTDGEPRRVVEGTTITIAFADGALRAHAGCNQLSADLDVSGERLEVDSMTTTDMGCAAARMEQDDWLVGFLRADPSWALDGSTLTLEAEGTTMVLSDAADATPSAELVGPTWVLDTIVEGGTASSVPAGVTALLELSDDGTVVGRGTCNGYGATFEAGPDTITFEPGPTTLIACPDPEGMVEDAVRETLTGTTTYVIDGSRLTITSADGSRELVYRPAA